MAKDQEAEEEAAAKAAERVSHFAHIPRPMYCKVRYRNSAGAPLPLLTVVVGVAGLRREGRARCG
jgi:hypothetical protein